MLLIALGVLGGLTLWALFHGKTRGMAELKRETFAAFGADAVRHDKERGCLIVTVDGVAVTLTPTNGQPRLSTPLPAEPIGWSRLSHDFAAPLELADATEPLLTRWADLDRVLLRDQVDALVSVAVQVSSVPRATRLLDGFRRSGDPVVWRAFLATLSAASRSEALETIAASEGSSLSYAGVAALASVDPDALHEAVWTRITDEAVRVAALERLVELRPEQHVAVVTTALDNATGASLDWAWDQAQLLKLDVIPRLNDLVRRGSLPATKMVRDHADDDTIDALIAGLTKTGLGRYVAATRLGELADLADLPTLERLRRATSDDADLVKRLQQASADVQRRFGVEPGAAEGGLALADDRDGALSVASGDNHHQS